MTLNPYFVLAHLSRRLIQVGELIVYPCSSVRLSSFLPPSVHKISSNIFSLETASPIQAKFYVEPSWEGGTKVYINGPGHMAKMATKPIYGKKTFKNLILQNQMSYDLECSIEPWVDFDLFYSKVKLGRLYEWGFFYKII